MNQNKVFRNTLTVIFVILAILSLGLFTAGTMALDALCAKAAAIAQAALNAEQSLTALDGYLHHIKTMLPAVVFGSGAAALLLAALVLRLIISRVPHAPKGNEAVDAQKHTPVSAPAKPPVRESTAVSLLASLQAEGRFIDFLQEDLGNYEDSQIGAAVRTIHQGCKKALDDAASLEPVVNAAEGADYVVEKGFDPASIKLVGNVTGNPPFKGILRHHGWRLKRIDIPTVTMKNNEAIIVPAEVEIG